MKRYKGATCHHCGSFLVCPNCGEIHQLAPGAHAVRSGGTGQGVLKALFNSKANGVRIVPDHPEFHYEGDFIRNGQYLIEEYPDINDHRIDFVFKSYAAPRCILSLAIEVKNQNIPGTTDEKIFSDIDQFSRQDEIPNLWLVLYGDGRGDTGSFRPKVVKRAMDQIAILNQGNRKRGRILFAYQLQKAIAGLVDKNNPW